MITPPSSHTQSIVAPGGREMLFRADPDLSEVCAVICIPTFRRPNQLRRTLSSVLAQQTSRSFAIVVVDNDAEERAGAAAAELMLDGLSMPAVCIVEPRQGNCFAINAAFETALDEFASARYILMIDDDEIAEPIWLESMIAAAEQSRSAIVGGPVFPNMDEVGRPDLARHPAFRPAYDESGPVPVIYGSGNCLIERAVFEIVPRPYFDLRFNFLGGGDTDFFARARAGGWKFYWAADAVIRETVPVARTRPTWLLQRALRIGAINYSIESKRANGVIRRVALVARNIAMLPLSVVRGVRLFAGGDRLAALHPFLVALGRLLAAIGIEPHQYSVKKSNS